MARLILALLLALVPAVARAAPATVYVVRHLHTPEGERDPDLTAEGRAAAAALPRAFRGRPLAAIYVSAFRRSAQTAAALAAERRIVPTLYDPADTPALVARVRAARGPVLVVGHSNTVPDIVQQLGGTRPAPLAHPDFGDMWTITKAGSTRTRLPAR